MAAKKAAKKNAAMHPRFCFRPRPLASFCLPGQGLEPILSESSLNPHLPPKQDPLYCPGSRLRPG
jgi:hypothetical protein